MAGDDVVTNKRRKSHHEPRCVRARFPFIAYARF